MNVDESVKASHYTRLGSKLGMFAKIRKWEGQRQKERHREERQERVEEVPGDRAQTL